MLFARCPLVYPPPPANLFLFLLPSVPVHVWRRVKVLTKLCVTSQMRAYISVFVTRQVTSVTLFANIQPIRNLSGHWACIPPGIKKKKVCKSPVFSRCSAKATHFYSHHVKHGCLASGPVASKYNNLLGEFWAIAWQQVLRIYQKSPDCQQKAFYLQKKTPGTYW